MLLRLFLLGSSFASAFGNFIFLAGLEIAQTYIFSLSFSSLVAGAFCYAILPNMVFGYTFKRVTWILSGLALVALAITAFSKTGGFVMLMLLTFLSAEIVFSAHRAWLQLTILRLTMLTTGGLSWGFEDDLAVMARALCVAGLVFLTLHTARTGAIKVQGAAKIASIPLYSLVATNLVWVYILPLLLINSVAVSEQKTLYIVATICPLLYFKAQDAVFKLDILSRPKGRGTPHKFLLTFAVPLAGLYVAAPFVRGSIYGDQVSGSSVLFSFSSLLFLALNLWLTLLMRGNETEEH